MYQDKLAHLKKQLQQLEDGTLPEFLKRKKKIEQQYKERLKMADIFKEYEVGAVCLCIKHQLFVTRLPTYWAKVQGNDFYIVLTVWGKCQDSNIRIFNPSGIFCYLGWSLRLGYYHQCVPTGWGLYQGTRNEKWLAPLWPVGVDWGSDYK